METKKFNSQEDLKDINLSKEEEKVDSQRLQEIYQRYYEKDILKKGLNDRDNNKLWGLRLAVVTDKQFPGHNLFEGSIKSMKEKGEGFSEYIPEKVENTETNAIRGEVVEDINTLVQQLNKIVDSQNPDVEDFKQTYYTLSNIFGWESVI